MSRVSLVSELLLPAICILCGAAGSVLVWGGESEDRVALNRQLEKFRALDDEQQQAVRRSFADFSAQSETRKSAINSVHRTVQQDPALRATIESYYTWWSALDQSEWDAFQEMNAEDRLTFARSRMNTEPDPAKQIVVEFPGPVSSRLPPLHMTFEEFGRIIAEALENTERPQSLQDEMRELSTEQHRTLRLALWVFETFPNQRDASEAERRGKLLHSAVRNNVSDTVWKARFKATLESLSGKPYERGWMFMTLLSVLSTATTTLGEDLHDQFPVTDQQIKDAFASLEDKELQQSLMTMPADEARTRLQFLAQSMGDRTPEEQLLIRYIRFAKDREKILRFTTFGFGGPGQFEPDRAGGKGGPREGRRDEGRRSRDDDHNDQREQ